MSDNYTIERNNQKLNMIIEEKKERKKYLVLGIIVIPLLLTILGMLVYRLSLKRENVNTAEANMIVTPDNSDEALNAVGNSRWMADGSFETSMTTNWHFSDAEEMSEDAYVQNVFNNTNDIRFEVALTEEPEHTIYKSPVIPRGSYLENIVLDEPLSAGKHDSILTYYLLDNEKNVVSSLEVNISIVVKK